jgi:phosphoribosylglycinamide formyltransferase-1
MRLAVLASWRGTNAKAIFDHVRLDVLRGVEPVLLIYSDAEAPVRKIAEAYGVDALLYSPPGSSPRGAGERDSRGA